MKRPYKKHWPNQNLNELITFLETQFPGGMSCTDLAAAIGLSQQRISALFKKDDLKLSQAESIVEKFGYTLTLYFPKKEYFITDYRPFGIVKMKEYPNAGNLYGLYEYMRDSNISVNMMSKTLEMTYSVIDRAFKTGDIQISTLYEILKVLGIEVLWSFDKID